MLDEDDSQSSFLASQDITPTTSFTPKTERASKSQGISVLKVSSAEISKASGQIFLGSSKQSFGGNGSISIDLHWMSHLMRGIQPAA